MSHMVQPYPDTPRLCEPLWLCSPGDLVLKGAKFLDLLHDILETLRLGYLLRGKPLLISFIGRTA